MWCSYFRTKAQANEPGVRSEDATTGNGCCHDTATCHKQCFNAALETVGASTASTTAAPGLEVFAAATSSTAGCDQLLSHPDRLKDAASLPQEDNTAAAAALAPQQPLAAKQLQLAETCGSPTASTHAAQQPQDLQQNTSSRTEFHDSPLQLKQLYLQLAEHQEQQAVDTQQCAQASGDHSQELRFLSPISLPSPRNDSLVALQHSYPSALQQQARPAAAAKALSPFRDSGNLAAGGVGSGSSAHVSGHRSVADPGSISGCGPGSRSSSKYSGSLDATASSMPGFCSSTADALVAIRAQSSQCSPSGCILPDSPKTSLHSPKTSFRSPKSSTMSPSQRLLFTDEVELSSPPIIAPLGLASSGSLKGSPVSPSSLLAYRISQSAAAGLVRNASGSPVAMSGKITRRTTTGSLPQHEQYSSPTVAAAAAAGVYSLLAGTRPQSASCCGMPACVLKKRGSLNMQTGAAAYSSVGAGCRRKTADIGSVQRRCFLQGNVATQQQQQHRWQPEAAVAAVRFSVQDMEGEETHCALRHGTPHPAKRRARATQQQAAEAADAAVGAAAEHTVVFTLPDTDTDAGGGDHRLIRHGTPYPGNDMCSAPVTAEGATAAGGAVLFTVPDMGGEEAPAPLRHGTPYPSKACDVDAGQCASADTRTAKVRFAVSDTASEGRHGTPYHGQECSITAEQQSSSIEEQVVFECEVDSANPSTQRGSSSRRASVHANAAISAVRHNSASAKQHRSVKPADGKPSTDAYATVATDCLSSISLLGKQGAAGLQQQQQSSPNRASGMSFAADAADGGADDGETLFVRHDTPHPGKTSNGRAVQDDGQRLPSTQTVDFTIPAPEQGSSCDCEHHFERHCTPYPGKCSRGRLEADEQGLQQLQGQTSPQRSSSVTFAVAEAVGAMSSPVIRHGTPYPDKNSRGWLGHEEEAQQQQQSVRFKLPADADECDDTDHQFEHNCTPHPAKCSRGRFEQEQQQQEIQLQQELSVRFLLPADAGCFEETDRQFERHCTPYPGKALEHDLLGQQQLAIQCADSSVESAVARSDGERVTHTHFAAHDTVHPQADSIQQQQVVEQRQTRLHTADPTLVRVCFAVDDGAGERQRLQRQATPFTARGRSDMETAPNEAPAAAVSVQFVFPVSCCGSSAEKVADDETVFTRHDTPHPSKSKPRVEPASEEPQQQQRRSKSGSVRFTHDAADPEMHVEVNGSNAPFAEPGSSTCSSPGKQQQQCKHPRQQQQQQQRSDASTGDDGSYCHSPTPYHASSICSSRVYSSSSAGVDADSEGECTSCAFSCSSFSHGSSCDVSSSPARHMLSTLSSDSYSGQGTASSKQQQYERHETPFPLGQGCNHDTDYALERMETEAADGDAAVASGQKSDGSLAAVRSKPVGAASELAGGSKRDSSSNREIFDGPISVTARAGFDICSSSSSNKVCFNRAGSQSSRSSVDRSGGADVEHRSLGHSTSSIRKFDFELPISPQSGVDKHYRCEQGSGSRKSGNSQVRSKFHDFDDVSGSGRLGAEGLSTGSSTSDKPSSASIGTRGSGRGNGEHRNSSRVSFDRLCSNRLGIEQPGSATTSRRPSLNMPSSEPITRRGSMEKTSTSSNFFYCSAPHVVPAGKRTTAASGLYAAGSSSLRSSLKLRHGSGSERAVQQQHQQSGAAAAKVLQLSHYTAVCHIPALDNGLNSTTAQQSLAAQQQQQANERATGHAAAHGSTGAWTSSSAATPFRARAAAVSSSTRSTAQQSESPHQPLGFAVLAKVAANSGRMLHSSSSSSSGGSSPKLEAVAAPRSPRDGPTISYKSPGVASPLLDALNWTNKGALGVAQDMTATTATQAAAYASLLTSLQSAGSEFDPPQPLSTWPTAVGAASADEALSACIAAAVDPASAALAEVFAASGKSHSTGEKLGGNSGSSSVNIEGPTRS